MSDSLMDPTRSGCSIRMYPRCMTVAGICC
jgi:hypothetical protein